MTFVTEIGTFRTTSNAYKKFTQQKTPALKNASVLESRKGDAGTPPGMTIRALHALVALLRSANGVDLLMSASKLAAAIKSTCLS